MLAVACDNFIVNIVDTGTKRIVRRFRGHTNRVTDMVHALEGHMYIAIYALEGHMYIAIYPVG